MEPHADQTLRLLEAGADYKKLYEYAALVVKEEHIEIEMSDSDLFDFVHKIKNSMEQNIILALLKMGTMFN